MEGTQTVLLWKIMWKWEQRNPDGTWVTQVAGEVLEAAGIKKMDMYI